MISSETRKKACRSSVIHPNVAASKYCCSDNGASRIMETESGTDMPRLHFPPIVLALRDCVNVSICSAELQWTAYSFVPLDKLLRKIVLLCMVKNVLDELWEDGFEFFEGGSLRHFDFDCCGKLGQEGKNN